MTVGPQASPSFLAWWYFHDKKYRIDGENENKERNCEQSDFSRFETTVSSPPLLDHLAASMVPLVTTGR